MAGADVEPNPAAAPRWAASERAGLIAAYRDGLGVAAVTMICGPAGFRIVPSALGDNAVLTAGETMQARWWCRRATDAQRVATAATARLRRRSLGGGDAASGVMALASDLVKSAARQCNVMLHSEQEISEEALDAAARIDGEIERLQRNGELKSVNKSYRQYRIDASARGERIVRYTEWMSKYRANLLRELAATLRQL